MKAIIPVAGAGTRLRPHTYTQPKPLIPVAGKPIISLIVDQLRAYGVDDFVFVIGYLGDKIRSYLEDTYPDLSMEFYTQDHRLGIAHAIWTAAPALTNAQDVLIALGDTILDGDLTELIQSKSNSVAIKAVDDPRDFGVVEPDGLGYVKKMVEKPKIPKSNLALVGMYHIKDVKVFLEVLDQEIQQGHQTHQEYQLTDVLQEMIHQGSRFSTFTVDKWFDCGKPEVLLATNAMLLDKEGYATDPASESYDNSIIIHPVSIGPNCTLQNTIVGPHVTIGQNTQIINSIISDSIIGSYAGIEDVVLRKSIVGSDSAIKGRGTSLNIGDNTEIDL